MRGWQNIDGELFHSGGRILERLVLNSDLMLEGLGG
jgi:hypothetical protein